MPQIGPTSLSENLVIYELVVKFTVLSVFREMKYITSNIPTNAGGLHNVCVRLGLRLMGIVDTIPKT